MKHAQWHRTPRHGQKFEKWIHLSNHVCQCQNTPDTPSIRSFGATEFPHIEKNKKQQKIYTHQQFASSTAMIIHKQAKSRKSRKTRTHINSFPNTISNKNNVHHHRSTTCKDHTNKLNRAMATKRNKVEINTNKKNYSWNQQITASFQQQWSHEQAKLNHATKTNQQVQWNENKYLIKISKKKQ